MSTFTDYYVGYEIYGYYLTTSHFDSLEEAQTAFNVISTANPDINFNITSTVHSNVTDSNTLVNTNVESPFTGMTYESFGKGFLLRPTPSHPDTGTKYFHNGWWMPMHNAWFFKTNQEQTLCEGGSIYISDDVQASTTDTPTTNENVEDTENPFYGMTFNKYGKGYLLTPSDNHPAFGTKYFHNGWWIPSLGGWFFKTQYFNDLIEGGAFNESPMFDPVDTDEEYETDVDEFEDVGPFTDMTIDTYGRGYLLVPPADHPNYGEKYFHNGWWLTSQNAWFFKTKHYDYLIDNGATLQANESKSNKSENVTHQTIKYANRPKNAKDAKENLYSGMNITHYGISSYSN